MYFWLRRFRLAFLLIVPLGDADRARQPATFDGTWRVMWDADVRARNGVVERVNRRAAAQLVLTQRADSVHGRWIDGLLNDEAAGTPGVGVRGTARGDTVVLTSGTLVTARGTVRISLRGVRRGTRLGGTLYVELDGLPPAPRTWDGERGEPNRPRTSPFPQAAGARSRRDGDSPGGRDVRPRLVSSGNL